MFKVESTYPEKIKESTKGKIVIVKFYNYLLYMVIIIIIIIIITIVTSKQIMIWRRCVKLGNREIKIHVYAKRQN